jgi:tetratricopeptide (TPR) repeat protein
VLKLQTDIANAVAGALKIRLLADEAAKIEVGGTHNPAAFDAYLRGSTALMSEHSASTLQGAITAYTEATRLDPNYALAFAGRSQALTRYATEFATGTAIRGALDKSQADARHAVGLAPELAEGPLALGLCLSVGSLDFAHASEAYERAMALAPGNAVVLSEGGRIATCIGRFDAGLAAAHRAVTLDPLNPRSRLLLAQALYSARRYQEAVAASTEVITGLDPEYEGAYAVRGLAYYELGDFQNARSSCESRPDHWLSRQCLAVVYNRLGRHGDAEAELAKMKATDGDADAYQYAAIYAQWGNTARALGWLASAMRVRDAGLVQLKTDPFMDPLRLEPRFKAIERELEFPP